MLKRRLGETITAVSPVIAIILMVAITVVLTGVIYMWLANLSAGGDDSIAYIGCDIQSKYYGWEVTITGTQGTSLQLNSLTFLICDQNSILIHSMDIEDSNPKAFPSGGSMVYPLASNTSGVISSITGQPVDPGVNLENYVGAIFVILDFNSDGYLNHDDNIRIFSDFDGDGNDEIDHTHYFSIKDTSLTNNYLWKSL